MLLEFLIMLITLKLEINGSFSERDIGIRNFDKFYRRHNEMISKVNVGLKLLLHQGLSESEFYGDNILYKFNRIMDWADISDQFINVLALTEM